MTTIPEHIAVGPLSYAVSEDQSAHDRASVAEGRATWGIIQYGSERILLDPEQSPGHKRMALLHEVLHACWHLTDRAHDDDEAACLALSGPLLDTLRRNPTLVAYLLDED
jgi:hypothetical protein